MNDQLGNARVIFRKPTTKTYRATAEVALAEQEEKEFTNLAATRREDVARAFEGSYVAALVTPGEGPRKSVSVEKGDTITFSAQVRYFSSSTGRPASRLQVIPLINPAASLLTSGRTSSTENAQPKPTLFSRLSLGVAITGFGGGRQQRTSAAASFPDILIRYRYYDSNNELKAEEVQKVNTGPEDWQKLQLRFRAPGSGGSS
ncbi:hypothetical protein [Hymenobacter cellulosilyticus]|uniref:Uncharacterized protein n=1 Tax=Hymenobacter cellulosilyticus TaxID=2932248 RepID=A0A8T9QKC2_9BACT|nr:hypothetical protein [Hymenobacter cellulosilyticus]UOQ75193.1 hypothetical protein MUN79_28810 [Hymenobacter cellulosilyticus]